ncbi:hypothetical protein ZWY2020_054955 [Hordeum vulgare]|nr:hypothetical protein ZWY2020_054955 [Hordeum vulgare]
MPCKSGRHPSAFHLPSWSARRACCIHARSTGPTMPPSIAKPPSPPSASPARHPRFRSGVSPSRAKAAGCSPPTTSATRTSSTPSACHREYRQVAISVTECTVLIVNMLKDYDMLGSNLSFARPGDKRWSLLPKDTPLASSILYNDKDGLFYILYLNGTIGTLDLRGPDDDPAPTSDVFFLL